MDEMSEGNIFWPNMCEWRVRENIDSHYLLDAYDNGMVYGRRAFNGVQHQPIHTGFPNSSSLAHRFSVAQPNARHNAIGIPLLPLSYHLIQDAYDNGMVYGRRAFNGVQHQPIHTGFPNSSSLAHRFSVAQPNARHNAIGIPLLPLSNHLIQAPTPSLEIATNDPQSNHDIVRSRSETTTDFSIREYQAQPTQEMRGNSIDFHPPLTLPTNPSSTFFHLQYRARTAQEMRGYSIDFHHALTLPTNPLSTSSSARDKSSTLGGIFLLKPFFKMMMFLGWVTMIVICTRTLMTCHMRMNIRTSRKLEFFIVDMDIMHIV
ncbi:hypothetical protein ACSQ67_023798 [Phaseolus vulgaris]